ncbi:hypothetical protein [Novosphingobium percolationis]|uniref:hypothetical protein n=1 Tax=Novosphingobium percolationis TaxID=2871811 RepID=UPI001CD2A0FC|nr:hypothetical protein [Novosphingobium percolationis]
MTTSFPYAHSRATIMLNAAIRRHTDQHPGGLRALASALGIKQATVLSHMSNGRMAIPLERAPQLAEMLKMNAVEFTRAVLEQREPMVWALLTHSAEEDLPSEVRRICDAAASAPDLSTERVNFVLEVLRGGKPIPRRVNDHEAALLDLIQRHEPLGMSDAEWEHLMGGIEYLLDS